MTEWAQDELFVTPEPVAFTEEGPVPFSVLPEMQKRAQLLSENKKLRRLVVLLTDWNARSEEITTLRKELGL